MADDRPSADISDWGVPGGFVEDGILYPPFNPEALRRIKEGNVPDYEVLVATYPRSGKRNKKGNELNALG